VKANSLGRTIPIHYNPATGRYWYRRISSERVPENKRAVAESALPFFAADLKLPVPPEIIWVEPVDWQTGHNEVSSANKKSFETGAAFRCDCFHEAEDFGGFTKFGETKSIHVRSDLGIDRIPGTIAHELRHTWQDKEYGAEFRRDCESETDASRYEREALIRFMNR